MPIRWNGFELPSQADVDKSSLTREYGKFVFEPFERGFGVTIGNSLRRVLLSSLEGVAPVSLRLQGALHEFSSIPGIYEDVINIALNVKTIRATFDGPGPETLRLHKKGKGKVLAGDLTGCATLKVANPTFQICEIIDDKVTFDAEIVFRKGRRFVRAEDFTFDLPKEVGLIPLDASFSPIERVRYRVEETRVGKMTNYDKLVLEIWTDGTLTPEDALMEAGVILRKHLNPFVKMPELGGEFKRENPESDEGSVVVNSELPTELTKGDALDQSVSVLEPSVRAANCLAAEGIKTLRDLVKHNEQDMLNVKNFGKTSMKEIKLKLAEMGLAFGMDLKND
ncbi:DNA-directed RNA polymerase subunit alpha [Planctomycetales bacterium]|nr:DNA-directed RNA polymerase subunit alpha [Planctomycetales bacterium]GHS99792.1 DNA-directed RNA polymerase subunit alpha [Planctomycetales bacterium]GHT07219.1 DNA-directed RNA polymerase subunit alpha [Planctomycetales bacterium]GHV18555.1 DNA-directed RNA polymerase subunit alpha [Planctomycetales bacterium]